MANRLKGEASFVDPEHGEMTLCFDAEAFLQFEDETGVGLLDLGAGAGRKLGTLAQLMVFGLRRHHPDLGLTREGAFELLMTDPAAQEAVMAALERALPDAPEASAGGNGNRRQRRAAKSRAGTGTNG